MSKYLPNPPSAILLLVSVENVALLMSFLCITCPLDNVLISHGKISCCRAALVKLFILQGEAGQHGAQGKTGAPGKPGLAGLPGLRGGSGPSGTDVSKLSEDCSVTCG